MRRRLESVQWAASRTGSHSEGPLRPGPQPEFLAGRALWVGSEPQATRLARMAVERQRARGTQGGWLLGSLVAQLSKRDEVARTEIAERFDA